MIEFIKSETQLYKVYIRANSKNQVEHIYSSCFEEYQNGDIFIKEGCGDEFVHVGYYRLFDERGCHNYKVVDGEMVETTEEEKQKEYQDNKIDICPPKTLEERLEEAEQKLAESEEEKKLLKAQVEANASSYEFLESCIMEMAEKVYA